MPDWKLFKRHGRRSALDPRLASLPPAEAAYVVIDTELTGLDPERDAILSIGGVRVTGGRLEAGATFYQEACPECELSPQSIVVHGITPEEVRERPAIGKVLASFVEFCADAILVGHFIEIDLIFLRKALTRSPGVSWGNPALDTFALYDRLSSRTPNDGGPALPRVSDPRLYAVARALGVPCRDSHNALGDAFLTAQVFQRLLRLAPRWGITTTAEILNVGDPSQVASRLEGGSDSLF
jgi:DNA polymerase-3 subunit epsilon